MRAARPKARKPAAPRALTPAAARPTGLAALDATSLAFRPGELALVAGRTGHGKTALLANLAWRWLRADPAARILFYSLEMSPRQVAERFQALAAAWRAPAGARPLSLADLRGPLAGPAAVAAMAARGAAEPVLRRLETAYTPLEGAEALCARARAAARRGPVAAVMVDPMRFLAAPHEEAARRLKALAVELDCPVLATVPMRRIAPEEDAGELKGLLAKGTEFADTEVGDAIRRRRPRLAHLPSLALEQEADLVLALLSYLADYNEEQDPDHRMVFPQRHVGPLEVAALKHRAGPLESAELTLDDRTGLVADPA